MGHGICWMPGFVFDTATDGSTFVDVVVEYRYFDRDYFASGATPSTSAEQRVSCLSYVYDDALPIAMCAEGFSVTLLQEALGLTADGSFGPATAIAVRDAQQRTGLPVTGVVDAATWAALGVTAHAPYPDLNGDGVIDGSEFPFD